MKRTITTRSAHFACSALGLLAFFAGAASAEENPDALKQQILAQARTVSPDDYAFTRTVRAEQIDGEKTEKHVIVERFDPTKPAAQRWTFVSIDGRSPSASELKNYVKTTAKRRVISYGRLAEFFGERATVKASPPGHTIFSFAALPKGTAVVRDIDLSADASADAIVNTEGPIPFVEEVRITSAKPTRVKLIALIERWETSTHYRLLPNGKPVPAEQVTDVTGSMLGKHGSIRSTISYTDLRAVR
ncbi:MAG: hypothetical protein M3Z22_00085 [Verrucomicrobiota bacterium]|nr:hypothetical protein [Verrucomicrobiota bacterium]